MARLLLIEDEAPLRRVIGEVLREQGHEVIQAGDAPRALALLGSMATPDLILTDLFLPRMGGRELLAELGADARWRRIPVILVTGAAYDPAEFPPSSAYQALLPKPFDIQALVAAVRSCLRESLTEGE